MASRYWIQTAGGTWDSSDTSVWSSSSGGSSGASVPTSSDDVFLDANSGANTVTVAENNLSCKSLTCTGFTGTLTASGASYTLKVYGNCLLVAGMTFSVLQFSIRATSNLTTGGKTLPGILQIFASGGTVTLQDTLNCNDIYLILGAFNANNQNINCDTYKNESGTTTTMGSGTWTVSGVLNASGFNYPWHCNSGATITANTSTIKLTNNSSTDKTFLGGGKTYNDLWIATSGSGTLTITGSNTFDDLKADAGRTLYLTAGTTQTCSTTTMTGTAGNHITIESSSGGSTATLDVTTPTVERCDVKDIIGATGTFDNGSGVDNGNNTGWRFLFKDPANLYASDDTYAECDAASGVIGIKISKDNGSNYSVAKEKTFTGSETTQTYGADDDSWGVALVGSDFDDGNLKVQVYCGTDVLTFSNFKDFGFTITDGDTINGVEITMEAKWDGTTTFLDRIQVKAYFGTSAAVVAAGSIAFASNGRKPAEGLGAGTGMTVFYDGTAWRSDADGTTIAA